MSPAIVLAIVVATQNVDDQATEAMRATAAEAIGGEESVVVREVEVPSDAEALRVERSIHPLTVAHVTWLDAAHTRARVRVHVAETNRWTERLIVFNPVDSPNERGRAVGFAVTAMLPEEVVTANPYRMAARAAAAAEAGAQRTALRLSAIGATGLGGSATGLGGAVAGEFFLTGAMWLRLGFGARQGSVPGLSGDDLAAQGVLGMGFWPVRPSAERRLAVGVRVDGLLLYHGVTRSPAGEEAARLTKWLPGLAALAELAWNVADSLEIISGVGVEAALGNTNLDVNTGVVDGNGKEITRTVTTIPALRGVGEIGIRVLF